MFFGFILLFSSLSYVADLTNYLFFNDEPCIDRPTIIIYLNPVEHRNYPFMISLNKCTGSCNVLSPKKYVPKKPKRYRSQTFNVMTNNDEAKAITKHISCDCKYKFNSTTCNSKQKWNNKTCQRECKKLL